VLITRVLLLKDDWLTLMSLDQFVIERRAGLLIEIGSAGDDLFLHAKALEQFAMSSWMKVICPSLAAAWAAGLRRSQQMEASLGRLQPSQCPTSQSLQTACRNKCPVR